MKVYLEYKDGIKQPIFINRANLERIKAKYGPRLTYDVEHKLFIRIERFTCVSCRMQRPIIENFNNNLCFKCKYGVDNEPSKSTV